MKRFAIDLGVVGFNRVWGDVRLPPVGYANYLMGMVLIRLPFERLVEMARYANDFGVGSIVV
jgi:hypothetical protein